MADSPLKIVISNEYLTDVKSKSFWIGTFVTPLLMVGFGLLIGFLSVDNPALAGAANPAAPDPDDLSAAQLFGMMVGVLMMLFLMMYGAQIYNKVKTEKTNRVVEILATCVPGRTMLMAKIISVGLVGLTQLALWGILIAVLAFGICLIAGISIPPDLLGEHTGMVITGILISLFSFICGYVFYGSLYAACGAMTGKNNENQGYMSTITFILLAAFYLSEFVAGLEPGSTAAIVLGFIPFFSPSIIVINALSGGIAWWITLLQALVLVVSAYGAVALAGKLYTSTLLLQGKKLTPTDLATFLKAQ